MKTAIFVTIIILGFLIACISIIGIFILQNRNLIWEISLSLLLLLILVSQAFIYIYMIKSQPDNSQTERIELKDIEVSKKDNVQDMIKSFEKFTFTLKDSLKFINQYVAALHNEYKKQQKYLTQHDIELAEYNKSIKKFQLMEQIEKAFRTSSNVSELMNLIAKFSARVTNSHRVSIMILNRKTGLNVVSTLGWSEEERKKFKSIEIGEGIAGKVAKEGKRLLVTDIESHPDIARPNSPKYKTKSFISMPLITRGRIVGVLNITDKKDLQIFDNFDLEILNNIIIKSSYYLSKFIK